MKTTRKRATLSPESQRVTHLSPLALQGVPINILHLGDLHRDGLRLVAEGADDAAIVAGLRAFANGLFQGAAVRE